MQNNPKPASYRNQWLGQGFEYSKIENTQMLIHWQYNQKQVIGFNEQIYRAALNKIQWKQTRPEWYNSNPLLCVINQLIKLDFHYSAICILLLNQVIGEISTHYFKNLSHTFSLDYIIEMTKHFPFGEIVNLKIHTWKNSPSRPQIHLKLHSVKMLNL